ncbi:MAG: GNAT family N-acetyltransferase [Phycisphaerae bacterium]|nr:GNAT family N-acetyltransferase [Phycisphaerae bacterium]
MQYSIGTMQAGDITEVSELICESYRFLAVNDGEGYTEKQLNDLIELRGSVQAIKVQFYEYHWLLAKSRQKIVGTVAWKDNEIEKLYVLPSEHRKGIGKKLFEAAKEKISDQGYEEMNLSCSGYGLPFYHKMGMEVYDYKVVSGPLAGHKSAQLKIQL